MLVHIRWMVVSSSIRRAHKRNVGTAPGLVPPESMCIWRPLYPGLLLKHRQPHWGDGDRRRRREEDGQHSHAYSSSLHDCPSPHNSTLPGNDAIAIENVLTPSSSIYMIISRKICKHSDAGPPSCTMATGTAWQAATPCRSLQRSRTVSFSATQSRSRSSGYQFTLGVERAVISDFKQHRLVVRTTKPRLV